jgi:hypothetical protein
MDPRTGMLLSGHTVVDSLALRMMLPWPDSALSAPGETPRSAGGMPVAVRRVLELQLLRPAGKP